MKKIFYTNKVHLEYNFNSLLSTLSIMKKFENESLKDSEFKNYIQKNLNISSKKKLFDKIIKIHDWVNENIQYQEDNYDETIIAPRILIYICKGDCDDFALITKTILKYFNINSNYILLAKEKNNYTHIANVIDFQNNLLYIDATMKISKFPKQYLYYKIIKG